VNVEDLDTPALVLDLDRVEANIAEMQASTDRAGVRLRPHTKTHKIPEITAMQLAAGAAGITCAKLGEAEVMVAAGATDVLVAYPLYGPAKLARLAALRERARVLVSLDSLEVARGLGELGAAAGDPVEVYVEVDTGQHRMGRAPGAATLDLVTRLAEIDGIALVGLLTHAGHAYGAVTLAEREAVVEREIADLLETQYLCAEAGIELDEISVGSTPAARQESRRAGVTEVRPGTYVFNDTAMMSLGVASEATCAATVVATVVARPTPERFVIDAGTKCLTSDGVGRPGWLQVMGRPDLTMSFTSEEHGVGVLNLDAGTSLAIGDRLAVIPSHVCPVLNLFDTAWAVREGRVESELRVAGRGRVR
jgi:D-serine deaminase-like pyridoxal phosphate-dependent protein